MVREVLNLILKHKLCPKNTRSEWLEIVCYMQEKNWLHLITEDNKLKGLIGAYRIEEYNEHTEDSLPTEEKGNVLYIPFACSESEDRFVWLRMRKYLKEHNIKEVIFNERHYNGRLKRIKTCNKQKN